MIPLFPSGGGSRRQQRVVVIDLGTRTTKAVYVERRPNDEVALLNYVVEPGLGPEAKASTAMLADHLRKIHEALGAKSRQIVVAISPAEGVFRNIELPEGSPAMLRNLIRQNSKQYFQQELADFEVDCTVISRILAPPPPAAPTDGSNPAAPAPTRLQTRQNVLVAGASQTLVDNLVQASTQAGLILTELTFTQSGLITTARHTRGALLKDNAIALINIGVRTTSVTILLNGDATLSRVIPIGADHFTIGLATELGITHPVAEGIKITMAEKVFAKLQKVSSPLVEELRTSIDFFEQQHERIISHALITGASARSETTTRLLQEGLVVPRCQTWNPAESVTLDLPSAAAASFPNDSAQLTGALALAQTCLVGTERPINLLAERQEEAETRRRDPVKRTFQMAVALVAFMVLWGLQMYSQVRRAEAELSETKAATLAVKRQAEKVTSLVQKVAITERQRVRLHRQAEERFLWTGPLEALQHSMVDGVQVVRLHLDQSLVTVPATKAITNINGKVIAGKPASLTEKVSLFITARDFGDPPVAEKFIATLAEQAYFKERLREEDPIMLRERMPQQVDPLDTTRRFIPFTIECVFKERTTHDD